MANVNMRFEGFTIRMAWSQYNIPILHPDHYSSQAIIETRLICAEHYLRMSGESLARHSRISPVKRLLREDLEYILIGTKPWLEVFLPM
jgi:hypothetical protein